MAFVAIQSRVAINKSELEDEGKVDVSPHSIILKQPLIMPILSYRSRQGYVQLGSMTMKWVDGTHESKTLFGQIHAQDISEIETCLDVLVVFMLTKVLKLL